ncbi:peptidoglycan-binding protein [Actinocrispum sp. NPDC049592]|uniref:peptidoglycan-binding domain-containing protein n=1 Tax=Actinocrispum sp. NPDC049592 TaxID=3154835 RepID=UPI00342C7A2F
MACSADHQRSDHLADLMPQVNYGDSGQHVLALQLVLVTRYGYDLQGTGNYASKTLAAVKDFQRKHGINDSGIVGSKTWHALVGPIGPMFSGNGYLQVPTFGITPGETNEEKMRTLYNAVMRVYPYYMNTMPQEGNTYGPGMQALVKDFQRRTGINPSGIVGPKTWNALYEVISVSGQWGC